MKKICLIKLLEETKKKQGITLIALIVTIVVLIIIATISINATIGENGIIKFTAEAKDEATIQKEKTMIQTSATQAALINENGDIEYDEFKKILDDNIKGSGCVLNIDESEEGLYVVTYNDSKRSYLVDQDGRVSDYEMKYPEEQPNIDTTITTAKTKYGVIEVEFLKAKTYTPSSTPNPPKLTSEMKKVYWETDSTGVVKEVTEGDVGFDESKWYNYEEQTGSTAEPGSGTSKWANVKINKNGNDSYFVWIPRYAYRIVYFDTQVNEDAYRNNGTINGLTGYSDARGIVTADGKRPNGVNSLTAVAVNDKLFRTHPAFENDINQGGWTSRLEGIWVAKYEACRNDAASNAQGSSTLIKIAPNTKSIRFMSVSDMYVYSKAYAENLYSHLIKNSEWGATVYLADSKYGRNGIEVTKNNSWTTTTGNAGDEIISDQVSGVTNAYDTPKGGLASTTGNIYGIYDMCGGYYDATSAYYNNGDTSTNDFYQTNANSFASKGGNSDEYSTVYLGTDPAKYYIAGDALYETATWNGDSANNMEPTKLFLYRGGVYASTNYGGTFYFDAGNGASDSTVGFRMSLIVN